MVEGAPPILPVFISNHIQGYLLDQVFAPIITGNNTGDDQSTFFFFFCARSRYAYHCGRLYITVVVIEAQCFRLPRTRRYFCCIVNSNGVMSLSDLCPFRSLFGAWITGNPHTTRPWVNQSSSTVEHVEINWDLNPGSHKLPIMAAPKIYENIQLLYLHDQVYAPIINNGRFTNDHIQP
jgi:hypothetical protein